jgi:alpha-glucoside transport system permease protein
VKDLTGALGAILIGIFATLLMYWLGNFFNSKLPRKIRLALEPYVFIGPVLLIIGAFLVWPVFQSIRLSFMAEELDGSTTWVGLQNFKDLFAEEYFWGMIFNNILWIAIVPIVTVIVGLAMAQFANNVGTRREKFFKSIFFMPMTISFVSAAVIWRYIYAYQPDGQEQVGLLNKLWTSFGGAPQAWLQMQDFQVNDLLMMVIFVWLNAGFSMVLLSAAIKSVPEDTLEAGRMDGASNAQIFFRIILPQILPTALAVFITTIIGAMKIFDIVLAMTGGNYGTTVLAQTFFLEYFSYGNTGKAMAAVVLLMAAITPIMIYQVRHYKKMEGAR